MRLLTLLLKDLKILIIWELHIGEFFLKCFYKGW